MSALITDDYKLFTPLTLGKDLTLKNRVVFSPLTRARVDPATRVPGELQEIYYEQRSGAGLIIAEATGVSEEGLGWYGSPGLFNDDQLKGWTKVEERVHAKGGKIFAQLWHMGRKAHPSFNPKNECVAPSAIPVSSGRVSDKNGEYVGLAVPRALETEEVPRVVEDFRKSAILAKQAGYDGVEIHSANGYLIDEFLQSVSNKRTDKYGGSYENRSRFMLEVIDAISTVYPSDRIAVRLSPNGGYSDMGSEDNYEMFTYLMRELSTRNLAFVVLLNEHIDEHHDKGRFVTPFDAKANFKGTVIANGAYTRDSAEGALRSGAVDAVCFGRPFISNPDLAERFQNDWPLNADAPHDVWYDPSLGAKGYIDFAAYEQDKSGRDCLKNGWELHKAECTVIATFRKFSTTESDLKIAALLQELGLSTEVKNVSEPKVIGVAKSLQMDETKLPGWFFSIDYELESKERQKALYQTVMSLYALLRDDGSWTRDKESFPRSSYTNVGAIPHAHPAQNEHIQELIQSNGHLLLFSAWLQHPEPPATQSMPLEDRSFYGVLDSLLQISAIRDGIDAFMDSTQ